MPQLDLKNLSADALASVVNLYPWFAAARMELCRRIAALGAEDWGVAQFAQEALYISDRAAVYELMSCQPKEDCSDKDLEGILRQYIAPEPQAVAPTRPAVTVVGGDFFSQGEYEHAQREDDPAFPRFAPVSSPREPSADQPLPDDVFCTETLAEIYAEQGYFAEAEKIYSRLSLANPEKITYFAALIEKLKQN